MLLPFERLGEGKVPGLGAPLGGVCRGASAPVLGGPWWGSEGSLFPRTSGAKATVLLLGQPEPLALSMHCAWSLARKLLGDPFLMFSLFSMEKTQGLGILYKWFGE